MSLDIILSWIQRISLVGFMLGAYFIVTSANVLQFVLIDALLLYFFIAATWVRQERKNLVPIDEVTQQVAGIVLGTVMIVIVIVILFKVIDVLAIPL